MEESLTNRIYSLVKEPIQGGLSITQKSTPIPFFGNLESAKVCTISLNPSDREFLDSKGSLLNKKRLYDRDLLKKEDDESLTEADAKKVVDGCEKYFENNPYRLWFNKMDYFLKSFESTYSYYSKTAVALDLAQWATTPKWSSLSEYVRSELLSKGIPFLKDILEYKKFDFIFLNGKTVFEEVVSRLKIGYNQKKVTVGKTNFSVYFGKYASSNVIGWSVYLQSKQGGGYENICRIAKKISEEYQKI